MIAVVDSLLVSTELTGVERVLVVCPVNALLNWRDEYEKWIPWSDRDYHVSLTHFYMKLFSFLFSGFGTG